MSTSTAHEADARLVDFEYGVISMILDLAFFLQAALQCRRGCEKLSETRQRRVVAVIWFQELFLQTVHA